MNELTKDDLMNMLCIIQQLERQLQLHYSQPLEKEEIDLKIKIQSIVTQPYEQGLLGIN